jgi:hypothetical protein
MQLLLNQLSVLLNQNHKDPKINGMSLNLISPNNTRWVLDSGVTGHMTGNKNLLHNFISSKSKQYVTVANGDKIKIFGFGSIIFFPKLYHKFY